MPDRLEKLRVVLAELERELASVEEVDEGLRARLESVRAEINDTFEAGTPPEQIEPKSLIERLTAAEQEFEGAHPAIAGVVRRLIDGLAQLGI
jgi:chromosome segregation ATPase